MGFFGSMITAVVKVALTPVAVATDIVIAVVVPELTGATKALLESAAQDAKDAMDEIT